MSKIVIAGLSSLALMVVPGVSQADTGFSSISGLVFELEDLDPLDGVAPRLAWLDARSQMYAEAQEGETQWLWSPSGQWSPMFLTAYAPQTVNVSGELLPNRALEVGGVEAHIGNNGLSVSYAAPFDGGWGSGRVDGAGTFALSPQTALHVRGVLSLAVSGAGAGEIGFEPGSHGFWDLARAIGTSSYATAEVSLGAAAGGVVGASPVTDSARLSGHGSAMQYPGQPSASFNESLSREFNLNLSNASSASMVGQVSFSTYVFASLAGSKEPGFTPVPEPSTWALGVLGVGFVLARRRLKASA